MEQRCVWLLTVYLAQLCHAAVEKCCSVLKVGSRTSADCLLQWVTLAIISWGMSSPSSLFLSEFIPHPQSCTRVFLCSVFLIFLSLICHETTVMGPFYNRLGFDLFKKRITTWWSLCSCWACLFIQSFVFAYTAACRGNEKMIKWSIFFTGFPFPSHGMKDKC